MSSMTAAMPIANKLIAVAAIPMKERKPGMPPNSSRPLVVLYPQTPTQMMKTLAKKAAIFASDG